MRTIVFDLDYTLFDAKKFRDECLAGFFGMSAEEFSDYYSKYKEVHGNFSPDELLAQRGLKLANLELNLEAEINKYLLEGAEKILTVFKKNCDELILASFGNCEFQDLKIDHLKVGAVPFRQYFKDIIVEDKDKTSNEMVKALKGDELWFVNDNDVESKKIMELFRHLEDKFKLFLMEGCYSKDSELKKYNNLEQLGCEQFPHEYSNECLRENKLNLK